jgi:hypothetical protein
MQSDSPAPKVLAALFLLAIALHLIGIRQPFLGNFAQHQTDYATVVQRWVEEPAGPFPSVMRFMARGQNRIFLGDFPLNVTLAALLAKAGLPIESAGRGLSALFFFLSLYPFYQIALRVFRNKQSAFLALLIFVFSPLTLIYGQAFLLEMTALCYGLIGYYLFLRWRETDSLALLLTAGLSFSMMLATRIYFAPAVLPLIFLFWDKQKARFLARKEAWLFAVVILALPIAWQLYAKQAAQAQNDQSSLADNLKVFAAFTDPVLRQNFMNPAFFVPIAKTVILKLLNPLGFLFLLSGFTASFPKRTKLFLLSFIFAFLPLFILTPRKFVEFDYYFLPLVPAAALWAAMAVQSLPAVWLKPRAHLITLIYLGLSLRFSLAPMIKIPDYDKNVLAAAAEVREKVPARARVIASHGTSTSFLYYTHRDGWAFTLEDQITGAVRNLEDTQGDAIERLERFRSQGASYFAVADPSHLQKNPAFFDYLNASYSLISSKPGLIYHLQSDNPD